MQYSKLVAVLNNLDGRIPDDTFVELCGDGIVLPYSAVNADSQFPMRTCVAINDEGHLTSVFNRGIGPKFYATADGVEVDGTLPAHLLFELYSIAKLLEIAKEVKEAQASAAEVPAKTARFVKTMYLSTYAESQALYQLSEPVFYDDDWKRTDFVVVSTVCFLGDYETYIFPANERGDIVSWGELPGSTKDCFSHEDALAEAGFTLVE